MEAAGCSETLVPMYHREHSFPSQMLHMLSDQFGQLKREWDFSTFWYYFGTVIGMSSFEVLLSSVEIHSTVMCYAGGYEMDVAVLWDVFIIVCRSGI